MILELEKFQPHHCQLEMNVHYCLYLKYLKLSFDFPFLDTLYSEYCFEQTGEIYEISVTYIIHVIFIRLQVYKIFKM